MAQREDKSQFIRTLSIENQQKYSLKHIPVINRQQNFNPMTNRSDSLTFKRNSSKDKHEHRLDFMMKNLGQW